MIIIVIMIMIINALAPSSPLLDSLPVQSLLAVSLRHLVSTEEGSSWDYGCAWN